MKQFSAHLTYSVGFDWGVPFLTMISSPFCIHSSLSSLWSVDLSFNPSIICLGTAVLPPLLSIVFLKLDWGVPFVTMVSSPFCVHSSFSLFWGVYLSFNTFITCLGTIVVPPSVRIVIPRGSSFVKSAPNLIRLLIATASNLRIGGEDLKPPHRIAIGVVEVKVADSVRNCLDLGRCNRALSQPLPFSG
jgi:hypothetical protein